jgi:NADPH:quinone reductase-like Zn-dependent oxidoreductase
MSKVVRFHKTGPADVLQIEDLPLEQPKENEVRLRVEAVGLNRAEVMFRMGAYLEPPQFPARLGYEAAGVVDAVGPGVKGFKVGDRVSTVPSFSMNSYGVYGETAIVPVHALARYPSNLSPQEAASIWMQYLTAWGALVHYGKLNAKQSVLIPAASSSVGLAAIELTKLAGAQAIAVTRTSAKKKSLLDFGADKVIASAEEDLPVVVQKYTDGKGVDLVFDPVAGPFVETLAKCCAQGGQIIEYGNLSMQPTPFPLFAALHKGLTIRGYTLYEVTGNPDLRAKAERYIYEQLERGKLKPKIDRVFPLSQIVEAHRYMESNQQNGKIVVTAA